MLNKKKKIQNIINGNLIGLFILKSKFKLKIYKFIEKKE